MKNNLKVVCGTLAGIMMGGLTVVGANQAIQAMQNTEIKISLNGQVQEFKDEATGENQYPITYNNRTYLPLRNVANLSGLTVDYDSANNMVILKNNITSQEDASNGSFDERTKEARDYMQKEYEWSITPNWVKDSSQQNLINNASLEKKDNYYILKLEFVIPKIYDKDAIESAYYKAQENGIYSFDGYTFYKDNKLPIENVDVDYYQKGEILTTKMDSFYIFEPIPNKPYYYVSWSDTYVSCFEFELDKELEVILLPNDRITITFDRDLNTDIGKELTVEEYYQKAIKNEVSSEYSINGFEYKLDSIGNATLPWNNTNAVNFENGHINVNYHLGGI